MMDDRQIEEQAAPAKAQSKRGISIIWIVPLVALVIGGWLAFKAIREKGPTITITFVNAEGLEAGKTKIRYRDVTIGQVEKITLTKDISKVTVTAKLVRGIDHYLTDKTKFWVVRARVRGGSVSGLSTILSGAFIGIDPSESGKPTTDFTGLEAPPVVTLGQPGRHYTLTADTLGSLDIGAPIYYRQIQVGQVVGYGFGPEGKAVNIQIFIDAPYDQQVTEYTRFWNASGIDVNLNAQGLKVETQSLVSVISGGVAFELPKDTPPGKVAKADSIFRLYPDHAGVQEKEYTVRKYWLLVFDRSVKGLSVGAPVELYGIKVGEVVNLNLEFDAAVKHFLVPVLVVIEPQRVRIVNSTHAGDVQKDKSNDLLKQMVENQGLRAQLQSGNLLTGQMMINLAFFPDSPKVKLSFRDNYPVVPTVPSSFEQLQENIVKIVGELEKVPYSKIGYDVHSVLIETRKTLETFNGLTGKIDKKIAPQAYATLVELQKTLIDLQRIIGQDSTLSYNAGKSLDELTRTLGAVRELVDTLNNRPQSFIFGKEGGNDE
jgi:paraquat-inducible protein B